MTRQAVATRDERSTAAGPAAGARLLRALARCGATLRFYRKSQLAWRALNVARGWGAKLAGDRLAMPDRPAPDLRPNEALGEMVERKLAGRRRAGSAARVEGILQGRFVFLERALTLPDPVDWRLEKHANASRLWCFQLHYHEFLLDLLAAGPPAEDPRFVDRVWDLVGQWIDRNDGDRSGDAWHPYCISRRVPVWTLLWSAARPPDALADRFLGSLFRQLRYLEHHLEWDVRGNHLLENLRALAFGGAFFRGPAASRWLSKCDRLLRRELAEQVLPHGEHFERSPMYHTHVAELVGDIAAVVRPCRPELADICAQAARRMTEFLAEILHPDGRIPLLGDSCFGETVPAQVVLVSNGPAPLRPDGPAAQPAPARAVRDAALAEPVAHGGSLAPARVVGDYWRFRDGNHFLLFDAGPVGPDWLPAHAHCDLLSFEASLFGHRVFVDSGVYGYDDDSMRRYCRSTAAHNTLEIDGRNQCDVWSRFRMGYRGWPAGFSHGDCGGFHWACARHNAYRRLGIGTVGRWLACRPGGPWLGADWARGDGTHRFVSRFHLHPDVTAEQVAPGEIRIETAGHAICLQLLTPGDVTLETAWYCPRFGIRRQGPVVAWRAVCQQPVFVGWSVRWGDSRGTAHWEQAAEGTGRWTYRDGGRSWTLFSPGGCPPGPSA